MNIIFSFPGYEKIAQKMSEYLGYELGEMIIRHFPDKESFVQIKTDVKGRDILIVCGLNNPDYKAMALMFFSNTAKEFGARNVGLVAPYLGYMRQDKRFQEGEAVTSKIFAQFVSRHFDWLITIDPHLHRYRSLDEIYTIPTRVLHATDAIAVWVKKNAEKPVLIGPDQESEQWVADIALKSGAPYTILTKVRYGDKHVEASVPELDNYKDHTPVLIDDIISTARTMIEPVKHLHTLKTNPPLCIGVHALFAEDAYVRLQEAGVKKVVTCNTIAHESNEIDISDVLALGVKEMQKTYGV